MKFPSHPSRPGVRVADIHSLSDFQRNASAHIKRLRKTGQPAMLTVNGRPAAVILDPAAFEALLDKLDETDSMMRLAIGLSQAERGEGIPLAEFDARMRRKLGLAKRKTA